MKDCWNCGHRDYPGKLCSTVQCITWSHWCPKDCLGVWEEKEFDGGDWAQGCIKCAHWGKFEFEQPCADCRAKPPYWKHRTPPGYLGVRQEQKL